jgi:hypothetical protein
MQIAILSFFRLVSRIPTSAERADRSAAPAPLGAADAKLEQKLRRSVTSQERDNFPGAGQLGLAMKRVFTNSIVAFISVIAATSGGGDLARGGPSLVFGAGALSCGVWLQHAQPADAYHAVMASWIDGYLTAANESRSEAGQTALDRNTEGTGFDAWISCRSLDLI